MGERRPTAYCGVCDKLVVLNIIGQVVQHNNKELACSGSEQVGKIYPKGL